MAAPVTFALLCTALVPALAWQVEEAEPQSRRELRRALQRIIRAGRERFKPLQGARVDIRPGRETWYEARNELPGATWCRVYEHPLTYSCAWEKSPSRPDPGAFLRALAADFEAALGEGWVRENSGAGVRFREREGGTTLTLTGAQGTVRLTVAPGVRRRPPDDPRE